MSAIEDSVCKKIQERASFGLIKYGVTLERKDLSELDWLTHLSEELMDAANYVEVLIQRKENNSTEERELLHKEFTNHE